MPEPPLPSSFFLAAPSRKRQPRHHFFPLSRVQWSGVVGVPQAAVPVGNVDVAGT